MRAAVIGLLLLLSGCTACSTGRSGSGSADAGSMGASDSQRLRERVSWPAPCPPDAGVGSRSVAPRSGVLRGDWIIVPGSPPTCPIYVAASPSKYIPRLAWAPCQSGRAGCLALAPDWTGATSARILDFVGTEPVRIVNGTPMLVYQRNVPHASSFTQYDAYIGVVQPLGGEPVFAIGTDRPASGCQFVSAIGDDGIAVVIQAPRVTDAFVGVAPWCAPEGLEVTRQDGAALGLSAGGFVQYFAYASSRVFLELRSPNTIDIFAPRSNTVRSADGASRAYAGFPVGAPGGALVYDYTAPTGLGFVRADAGYEVLTKPAAGSQITAFSFDHSSSILVWAEAEASEGSGVLRTTLWSSSYPNATGRIVRRMVARLNDKSVAGGLNMVANAGMVLNVLDDAMALLTRVSDGQGWEVRPEAGTVFVRPVWVDDDEVWLSTATTSGANPRAYPSGIVRVRRSELGSPTVPSGL